MSKNFQWFSKFSTRERRLVYLAFAVIVLIIVYIYIAEPVSEWYQKMIEDKAAEMEILQKYQGILAKGDQYRKKMQEGAMMKLQIESGLLSGQSPEIASANLQSIVKEFARELQIDFERITINPNKEIGVYTEVGIKIPFSCYISELRDFLYKVETSSKLLFVTNLDIRVMNPRKPDKLRVTMDVVAFIQKQEASPEEEKTGKETAQTEHEKAGKEPAPAEHEKTEPAAKPADQAQDGSVPSEGKE